MLNIFLDFDLVSLLGESCGGLGHLPSPGTSRNRYQNHNQVTHYHIHSDASVKLASDW